MSQDVNKFLRQIEKKLRVIVKSKFTGKFTIELNCIDGNVGNYYSKAEAKEPNKILT